MLKPLRIVGALACAALSSTIAADPVIHETGPPATGISTQRLHPGPSPDGPPPRLTRAGPTHTGDFATHIPLATVPDPHTPPNPLAPPSAPPLATMVSRLARPVSSSCTLVLAPLTGGWCLSSTWPA